MRTTVLAPGSSIVGWARSAIGQLNDLLGDDLAAAYLIGGRCGPRTAAGPTQRWACGVDR
jgi:hypothetical protein